MKFTKMHGTGNDYIYINCFKEKVQNAPELSKKLSDRHFGIGGDGIILIEPSEKADCRMDMYNADGSRGKMCGNGIRCVGKYAYERGIAKKNVMTVETLSGIKTLSLETENGKVLSVEVNMGKPVLTAGGIPAVSADNEIINKPAVFGGRKYNITCVSMGNPHCVVFTDNTEDIDIERTGPLFENDGMFPERVNTEFVQVIDNENVKMRVWERGSGETLACGTGACACTVACVLNKKTSGRVKVHLRGGVLDVRWDEKSGDVFMRGPAEFVFDGNVEI